VLNRQDKLFAHLSVDYLHNILEVGGRYACGNANSIMPIWSNEGRPPGPLNYIQIEDLIAFIRAPTTETFTVRDPELLEPVLDPITGEVKTFNGWVDPDYKPAPGATPYPACWSDEFATPTAAPSGAPGASASPGASVEPGAERVTLVASGIKWTTTELTVTAGKPFTLVLENQDASVPHNAQFKDTAGTVVYLTDTFPGVETREFQIPALTAGSYPFVCTLHPNMVGTLTAQ
jgi:plastocyanin